MSRKWTEYRRHCRRVLINWGGRLAGRLAGKRLEALHGKRIVIVSPHPDDEALGCGGLMCSLLAAGNRPSLILLTRGEHCHPEHIISCEEQARARRELTLEANALIGMNPADIHTLCFVDSAISVGSPEKERLRELIERLAPDMVFLPYEHDTSPDHQQANLLVRDATRGMSVRLYAYLVWFWQRTPLKEMLRVPWSKSRLLKMDHETRERKKQMIAIYSSAKSPEGVVYSGFLPREMIAAQLTKYEYFFSMNNE